MLEQIVKAKKARLATLDRRSWEAKLESMLSNPLPAIPFRKAISIDGRLSLVAEFKRRSPSSGPLRAIADPLQQARLYQNGGASALSVLTEEDFFSGSLDDIRLIKSEVELPVLRKDFIMDPLQVTETKAFGADAVLLIVRILGPEQLQKLIDQAKRLQIDCLCEVNSENEIDAALSCGADLIGINNRNLETFRIDLNTTGRLRSMIPPGITVVSESGIRSAEDARFVRSCGVDAILVGSELMRTGDISKKVRELLV